MDHEIANCATDTNFLVASITYEVRTFTVRSRRSRLELLLFSELMRDTAVGERFSTPISYRTVSTFLLNLPFGVHQTNSTVSDFRGSLSALKDFRI